MREQICRNISFSDLFILIYRNEGELEICWCTSFGHVEAGESMAREMFSRISRRIHLSGVELSFLLLV